MIRALVVILLVAPLSAAAEGTLYVAPRGGDIGVGERFSVRVLADSGSDRVSAVEGELAFNPAALEVVGISTHDSILNAWSNEPVFSNTEGYIRFSGWTGSLFEGESGLILTITFLAKRPMTARLDILSGALLSETGTSNILIGVQPGVYSIRLQEVTREEPEILGAATTLDPVQTTIHAVRDRITAGERFSIKGTAAPDALLTLRVVAPSGASEFPLASGRDGTYSYTSDPIREAGVYRVKVTALDGSRGDPSEQIAISVNPNMFAAAAGLFEEYTLSLGGIGIAVLLLAAGMGYVFHRSSRRKNT